MDIKKFLKIFLGAWAVLIFASYVTDSELEPLVRVVGTGVLALLITLLGVVALRMEKGKKYSLTDPASGEVLYRVEGEWIFRGDQEKATWYVKRGAVYSFDSMKPLYRIKGDKLFREGEQSPVWTVEDGKVRSAVSGQVEYEIR